MEKTININISGILFHIEEDGYSTLSKYLEAINRHFSGYKDSKEIVSDIENRIAEIFLSNLKNNKQVITAKNVDKVIEKMGIIPGFSTEEESEESYQEDPSTDQENLYKYVAPPHDGKKGYKKLNRLENNKIIGGVCAGIADYFSIDSLWPRLVAILLLFSGSHDFSRIFPSIIELDRPQFSFNYSFNFSLLSIIAYIVLWIILPVSYQSIEDKNIKKFFRNPDDKVLGGVASGLAAYLGIEVVYIRLGFSLLTFIGGSGIIIYVILWIITPAANSITERIKMKGGEITLDSIDSTIKQSLNPSPTLPESTAKKIIMTPFRVLGKVLNAIGSALGPLGNLIRVIFGLVVSFIGLDLTIASLTALGIYLGLAGLDYQVPIGNLEFFIRLIPAWLVIAGIGLALVHGIIFLLLGLSVLAKKTLIRERFALIALAVWLLCIGITAFHVPKILIQFREKNWHIKETSLPLEPGIIILKTNENEDSFNQINLKLEGTPDSLVVLEEKYFSRGKSKSDVMINAQSISYSYQTLDSVIVFDQGYNLASLSTFRNQKLDLTLRIPFDRPFIIDRSLLEVLSNTIYPSNGHYLSDIHPEAVWVFNQAGLVCLTCSKEKEISREERQKRKQRLDSLTKAKMDSVSRARFKDAYFMKK